MATGVPGSRGGEAPEFILREFGGVNLQASREVIGENEFFWLENAIPIASGNITPTAGPSSALVTIGTELGAPSYTTSFNVNGTDYVFAVWKNSGNGWIVNMTTFAATQIGTGLWTSGSTQATQWSNLGLLVIDPTGYWDWNVTTANTLTSQGYAIQAVTTYNATNFSSGFGWAVAVAGSPGSGAVVTANFTLQTATIVGAGTGYLAGDVLSFAGIAGTVAVNATITVSTVGGGGAITGITISNVGLYEISSALNSSLGAANPVSLTGGTGSGATATIVYALSSFTVNNGGSGYTAGSTITITQTGGVHLPIVRAQATVGGLVNGTTIAVYSGRVWIGNGRTVSFTDAGSYFSFGGTGSAFTITDAYLHNGVTALYPANNYLYIFGDDSIDALSNLTVSGGVASFSRININASIGTHYPTSIFPYYRGLLFANSTGFFALSGATPEKMSDKLSQLVSQIIFANLVWGGSVVVQNEFCAAFLFTFTDIFTTTTPAARTLLAIFFRGRWWLASMASLTLSSMVSIPVGGVQTLFAWAGTSLYQCFTGSVVSWLLKSRLWDAGAPLKEKQAINAAVGVNLVGTPTSGLSLYIDTEYAETLTGIGTFPGVSWVNDSDVPVTWVNTSNVPVTWTISETGYVLFQGSVQAGGSQYLGMTLSGGSDISRVRLLAMLGKQDRNMLR